MRFFFSFCYVLRSCCCSEAEARGREAVPRQAKHDCCFCYLLCLLCKKTSLQSTNALTLLSKKLSLFVIAVTSLKIAYRALHSILNKLAMLLRTLRANNIIINTITIIKF